MTGHFPACIYVQGREILYDVVDGVVAVPFQPSLVPLAPALKVQLHWPALEWVEAAVSDTMKQHGDSDSESDHSVPSDDAGGSDDENPSDE